MPQFALTVAKQLDQKARTADEFLLLRIGIYQAQIYHHGPWVIRIDFVDLLRYANRKPIIHRSQKKTNWEYSAVTNHIQYLSPYPVIPPRKVNRYHRKYHTLSVDLTRLSEFCLSRHQFYELEPYNFWVDSGFEIEGPCGGEELSFPMREHPPQLSGISWHASIHYGLELAKLTWPVKSHRIRILFGFAKNRSRVPRTDMEMKCRA